MICLIALIFCMSIATLVLVGLEYGNDTSCTYDSSGCSCDGDSSGGNSGGGDSSGGDSSGGDSSGGDSSGGNSGGGDSSGCNCCGYLGITASGEQVCVLDTDYENISYKSTYSQGSDDSSGCDGNCCTTLTFQFLYYGENNDQDKEIAEDFYVDSATYVNCNSWKTTCTDNSQSTDGSGGWSYSGDDNAWILEMTIPNVCLSKTLTQYQENTSEPPIDAAATVYMSYKEHEGYALIYITPMDADLSDGVCTANGEWRTANKSGSGAGDYNHVITQNQWPGNSYNQQSEANTWSFRWKVESCKDSNTCNLLNSYPKDFSCPDDGDCGFGYCDYDIPKDDEDVYDSTKSSCTTLELQCT